MAANETEFFEEGPMFFEEEMMPMEVDLEGFSRDVNATIEAGSDAPLQEPFAGAHCSTVLQTTAQTL